MRGIRLSSITLLFAAGFAASAAAGEIDIPTGVDIFIGTAQLFSPSHQLLSTTTAMTVEGAATGQVPDALLVSYGQNIASQISADPTIPPAFVGTPNAIPSLAAYLQGHIGSFANATGLGLGSLTNAASVNGLGLVTTDQAEFDFYTLLTTQPQPFALTADSGLFAISQAFVFVYDFGPFPDAANPANSDHYLANVNILERDVQETESAVPEPPSLILLGSGLLLLGALAGVRKVD